MYGVIFRPVVLLSLVIGALFFGVNAAKRSKIPRVSSQGGAGMYISVRKYRLRRTAAEVREAVLTGLVPILKASPGFQSHWTIDCSDGDIAAVSIFDTESNSNAATDRTLAWVKEHIRGLVVLPPEAMFGGEGHHTA